MKTEIVHGIEYAKPQVVLLQQTGIGVAEVAAKLQQILITMREYKQKQLVNIKDKR